LKKIFENSKKKVLVKFENYKLKIMEEFIKRKEILA